MKNIEVEVKYHLPNHEEVKAFLDKHAMLDKADQYQKDTYFSPAHDNFLDQRPTVDRWLRIRVTDRGSSINYKHRHDNGSLGRISCDEIETPIEDADQLEEIFRRIDMVKLVTVEKKRTSYHYKHTEVVLDYITDLGWFIEIENIGPYTTIEDASKNIFLVAEEIGVAKNMQDKRGYPYLLMEKKGML